MKKIILIAFTFIAIQVKSQINLPLSKLGFGEVNENINTINLATGATATNSRGNAVNIYNPASYGFLKLTNFDVGFSIDNLILTTSTDKYNFSRATFKHFLLGLPATKKMAFTLGYFPYSSVKYFTLDNIILNGDTNLYKTAGNGGLNNGLLGASYKIFNDSNLKLNAGLNVIGIIGNIENLEQLEFKDNSNFRNVANNKLAYYRGVTTNVGLIGKYIIKKHHIITLGSSLDIYSALKSNTTLLSNVFVKDANGASIIVDEITNTEIKNQKNKLPATFRIGASYAFKKNIVDGDNLILSLNYTKTNWNKAVFANSNDVFMASQKISAGISFTPSFKTLATKYYKNMHYALRLTAMQPNYNKKFNDYSATVLLGLPLKKSWSSINLGYTYGTRSISLAAKEKYHMVSINLLLNDLWFIKYKID